VHQRWPAVVVLLMSGYSAERAQDGDAAALQHDVLRKPFDRAALAQALAHAITRHGPR
jgi:CheY-like chemotaxis protein